MQNSPLLVERGTAEPWDGVPPLLQPCRVLGALGNGWDVMGSWCSACVPPRPTSPPALCSSATLHGVKAPSGSRAIPNFAMGRAALGCRVKAD